MPNRSRKKRSQTGVSELSQFPLALYLAFLVIFFPLIDLSSLLVAGAVQYLATNDIAAKAATQIDFSSSLDAMIAEAMNFQNNSLAKFVHLAPAAGYMGCGDDLCLLTTNIGSGQVQSSTLNQPLSQPIDTSNSMYELQIQSTYSVAPLVSMASMPLLGDIPGLGKPVILKLTANRPIENPSSLQGNKSDLGQSQNVSKFNRTATSQNSGSAPSVSATTWRTPDIFDRIKNAGQTVVSVNVLIVFANQTWQSSGISPTPGQQVWIDTSAVGTWGDVAATSDANGSGAEPIYPNISVNVAPGGQAWELLGYVGTPPTITSGMAGFTDPKMFYVGNTLVNYRLPATGNLSFMMNDSRQSTTSPLLVGQQVVRIIVTR